MVWLLWRPSRGGQLNEASFHPAAQLECLQLTFRNTVGGKRFMPFLLACFKAHVNLLVWLWSLFSQSSAPFISLYLHFHPHLDACWDSKLTEVWYWENGLCGSDHRSHCSSWGLCFLLPGGYKINSSQFYGFYFCIVMIRFNILFPR